MRRHRWRQGDQFNPYIVLADVTIATIVVFVVLLLRSETKVDGTQRALEETQARLTEYEIRDRQREELVTKIRERNKTITDAITSRTEITSWSREGKAFVAVASGPNTYLIRLYGPGLWTGPSGSFSQEGKKRAELVINTIKRECWEYLHSDTNPALIEIRIEGHCGEVDVAESSLELSLERAKTVRDLFPEAFERYISVSGFGSERPAYETTPATIRKRLLEEWMRTRQGSSERVRLESLIISLDNLNTGGDQDLAEEPAIEKYLDQEKAVITDRIDIILVYSGLFEDNNFVYPQLKTGEIPEWVNDVSRPRTEARFLQPKQDSEELP